MTQSRLALFGGTFDPIHTGHLLLAEAARSTYRLDRVLFTPTGTPPHKSAPFASSAHRLRMLRLAVRSNPYFDINAWEIQQKRIVYSYETIAELRRREPKAALFFILGTDMLRTLSSWKQSEQLLDDCTFLTAERPGIPFKNLPALIRRKSRRIEWPAVPFASHAIRDLVHRKQSIRYQVPDAVATYIRRHRLYA